MLRIGDAKRLQEGALLLDPALLLAVVAGRCGGLGFGAREAVVRALRGDNGDRVGFGEAASAGEVAAACREVLAEQAVDPVGEPGRLRVRGPRPVVAALAFAHGWEVMTSESSGVHVIQPSTP